MEVAKTFQNLKYISPSKGKPEIIPVTSSQQVQNSSSSLDTQTIPLKPLPCPAR
jgi:hypothetical protein